jgi:hypothetical protein
MAATLSLVLMTAPFASGMLKLALLSLGRSEDILAESTQLHLYLMAPVLSLAPMIAQSVSGMHKAEVLQLSL